MTDTLTFDLSIDEKTVDLNCEDGSTVKLLVKELTGIERDRWMTLTSKRMKTDGKNASLNSFDGIQASLISIACTYQSGEKNGQHPSVDEVNEWPARVSKALFDMVQQMSGLDEPALEREGN